LNLEQVKSVYFLGIGGIGMSALARYFKAQGKEVSGYDKTPTALTEALQSEGISVHFEDSIAALPAAVKETDRNNILIIITPAVPANHPGMNYLQDLNYTIKKRSEVLGLLTQQSFTVAVAGTHGKTTTSSMIAHILCASGVACTAFLGGITKNYNSNLLLPKSGDNSRNIVVVEADEYDRSFLTLYPDLAIITSMDADHLDIYGDKSFLEDSFRLFGAQVKKEGKLIAKKGLPLNNEKALTYSTEMRADYTASNIRIDQLFYKFDLETPSGIIKDIQLGLPGKHNVENAVAAVAVSLLMDIAPEKIKTALASYTGVKRRFDYQIRSQELVYIDDYAHHPEELKACINAVKEMYPGKKITGIFQPHLFSRTRDFAEGFSASLSLLDSLILMEIYPARELPIEGVNAAMLLDKITSESKMICQKENLLQEVGSRNIEILLTLGAGDIDQFVAPIKNLLTQKAC
jgi:UDP-N-acetylmuramate--alanine ligase